MEKGNTDDCCKDEQHKLTLKDSPKASPVVYEFNAPGAGLAFISSNACETTFIRHLSEEKAVINSSPRTQSTPAFIRNCNFRI